MPGFAALAPIIGSVVKGAADASNRRDLANATNRRNTFSVFLGNRVNGIPGPDTSVNTLLQGLAAGQNSVNQAEQQNFNRQRSLQALALLGGNAQGVKPSVTKTDEGFNVVNNEVFGPPNPALNVGPLPPQVGFGSLAASSNAQVDPLLRGNFTQFPR